MFTPVLKDQAFLDDVAAARNEPHALHIWWLGQSGFLLQWQGHHLLFDPYLSDSLTAKYADSATPHIRMTERVVAPQRLDFVEVVTSSHNHTDHLDAETLIPLMESNADLQILVAAANRSFAAQRLQVDPSRLSTVDVDRPTQLGPFTFHAVPAAHETLETDAEGRHKFIGIVAEVGPWMVYHSGDTMRYDGMVERLRRWSIDVAILPVNGRDPARKVAGNLDGEEAARLARDIGAGLAIPCHYEMFSFNTASPSAFAAEAREIEQPYKVLRAGERLTLQEPDQERE